jgi:hypothetical protein
MREQGSDEGHRAEELYILRYKARSKRESLVVKSKECQANL